MIQRGSIVQVSVSLGGVPKLPVPEAHVGALGLSGDDHRHPEFHGGPERAVCLYAAERIEALAAQGHPIAAGSAGENVTTRGIDWDRAVPGARLRLGPEVIVEITGYAAPCKTIARWFKDGDFMRLSQERFPGWSRTYARVVDTGTVRPGDSIELLPISGAALDGRVHHHVLTSFVERGFAPTAGELCSALAVPAAAIEGSLRRLHEGHGLVLHPDTLEVWVAHPFSASPTAVWVAAGARGWWAPCLWCAMGIATLAAPADGVDLHVRHAGEVEPATIVVRDGAVNAGGDAFVHFAIPPRQAWANVIHWCATVLPFRRVADVAPWCARHRLPVGAVVPLSQVLALGRAWYGRHLAADWRKWTVAEAQAIFDGVGLTGEFWRLPVSEGRF